MLRAERRDGQSRGLLREWNSREGGKIAVAADHQFELTMLLVTAAGMTAPPYPRQFLS